MKKEHVYIMNKGYWRARQFLITFAMTFTILAMLYCTAWLSVQSTCEISSGKISGEWEQACGTMQDVTHINYVK